MAETIHPFYESHRGAMKAAMRDRLDLAEAMFSECAHLSNTAAIRREVMDEFEIVLTQGESSAPPPYRRWTVVQ
jgi:hypothetical protein